MSRPTVTACILAVCEVTKLKHATILSASRYRPIARRRQIAMWVAREVTKRSYTHIGAVFCRDHTTVIHGVRNIDRLRAAGDGDVLKWSNAALKCMLNSIATDVPRETLSTDAL